MQKTSSIMAFAAILCLCISWGIVQNYREEQAANQIQNKKAYTPGELRKQEIAKKRVRKQQGYAKMDQPNEFAKYHGSIRTREGRSAPEYTANYKLRTLALARKHAQQFHANAKTQQLNWIERGPGNVPGRTRGVLVDPADTDANTWLVGSVSGGIWKTTDAGQSWTNKTPDLPNLSTSTLATSAAAPNIIYAGTGEGFFNTDAVAGDGIFKSIDRGETWTQLSNTVHNTYFGYVNRIVVDPNNPDIVIACTQSSEGADENGNSSFIARSVDGGNTWAEIYASKHRIQHIVVKPENFNIQYATVNSQGILKSVDAGQTWSMSSAGLTSRGRIELAISPVNPSYVYASAQGTLSGNRSDLFLSTDEGANWRLVRGENSSTNVDWLAGQGWYNNTIIAHPYDENIVYVGGVNLWKITVDTTQDFSNTYSFGQVTGVDLPSDLFFLVEFVTGSGNRTVSLGEAALGNFSTIEIRAGSGRSQRAHRFTVNGQGSGVAIGDYQYADYVDVPFEVWDTDNNRQLMISFRDQQEDGGYELSQQGREYISISTLDYNPSTPNENIAKNGGLQHEMMYFVWPRLNQGQTWDSNNLPSLFLRINWLGEKNLPGRGGITENMTDAYQEFSKKNSGFISQQHPDHHNLVAIKVNQAAETFKILNANDGGIFISNTSTNPGFNDGDWQPTANGYNTTQFYGADKKPGANEYIGGAQDNGTWRSPTSQIAGSNSDYVFSISGDGFEVLWHSRDANKIIGSKQNNGFFRTLNGGITWQSAVNGLQNDGPFISRLANARANPDLIFAIGRSGVYRSEDFGGRWTLAAIPSRWNASDIEVSEANTNIVWGGGGMSQTLNLFVSTDAGLTFNATKNFTNDFGNISAIGTHPTQANTAYALFSFANSPKVLRTTDLGQSWEDISGFSTNTYDSGTSSNGFPDVAVYSLLVMPHDTNMIWVGSEIGIIESTDNGQTWALQNSNLPSVSVWELKIQDQEVIAATHGRGIWSVQVDELPETDPPLSFEEDIINKRFSMSVYPNPVSSQTNIKYYLPTADHVTLSIYNIDGRLVYQDDLGVGQAGEHTVQWNVNNREEGIYIIRLDGRNKSKSLRVLVR